MQSLEDRKTMNSTHFDRFTRRLGARLSRRNVLVGTGLLSAGAATSSFTRVTAQTPVATSFEPVLAFRTYIVLGSMDEIRLQLALLTHHMEGQPGFLDYRVAELGDSTLAVISSFLGQEASDAAAEVEAAWIAENMSELLTEVVDSTSGNLLNWSVIGAGTACGTVAGIPCPGEGLTCCPTASHTDSPGICVSEATVCPPASEDASPVAACKGEGCTCATGTQFPCDDGLLCCADEDTPPGGPGVCRTSCD